MPEIELVVAAGHQSQDKFAHDVVYNFCSWGYIKLRFRFRFLLYKYIQNIGRIFKGCWKPHISLTIRWIFLFLNPFARDLGVEQSVLFGKLVSLSQHDDVFSFQVGIVVINCDVGFIFDLPIYHRFESFAALGGVVSTENLIALIPIHLIIQ